MLGTGGQKPFSIERFERQKPALNIEQARFNTCRISQFFHDFFVGELCRCSTEMWDRFLSCEIS